MLPYSAFNLQKAIPKSGALRVYGVAGDAHLQNIVLRSLLDALLDADARDFNMDTLDGESATLGDVFSRCGNVPFLAEHRIVVVSRAERLEGMHRSSADDGEEKTKTKLSPAKRLGEGLKNLPQSTVLILCRTPESPEFGVKAGVARCINANVDKVFDDGKLGLFINCSVDPKNGGMVTAIVENEAARLGIALERGAAAHLVERVGLDIARLLNEMDKCALRAGKDVVTTRIIDEMTKRAPHDTIFDLTDALGERNGARALSVLRELVGDGEAPERVLATFVNHLRKLLQARAILDAGLTLDARGASRITANLAAQFPQNGNDSVLSLLQNPSQSWRIGKLAKQARNFSSSQLQDALEAAFLTDLAMKGIEGDGGGQDSKDNTAMALELFVAGLC